MKPRHWLLALMLGVGTILSFAAVAADGSAPWPDELILELRASKTRFYAGERVAFSATLLVGSPQVRDIRYPRLKAVGLDASAFTEPRRAAEQRGDRDYVSYEFPAVIGSAQAGTRLLGPAELDCDVLLPAEGAAAVFGGSQSRTVTVHSEPIKLEILALPSKGRPADFAGAVGRFTVQRTVSPVMIRAGDPFTVITKISGAGTLDSLACPEVDISGVRAYPPRVTRTRDDLSCEQMLVSGQTDLMVPGAAMSYFDPGTGRFVSRHGNAVTVRVAPPPPHSPEPDPTVPSDPPPVRLPESQVESGPRVPAWVLPVLLLSVGLWWGFRTRSRRNSLAPIAVEQRSLTEAESALAAGDAQRFYLAVFRQVQAIVAERRQCHPSGVAHAGGDSRLRDGQSQASADDILAVLLNECDAVRYGRRSTEPASMTQTLAHLRRFADPSN